MLDINLNLYRIFCVVAQSKSYSDAADKLHLSVPSISVSINKLESLLDTPLFYREKDGVKLTEEGQELFKQVSKGLNSLDLGEKLILQKNDLENGEISIGCQSHLVSFYLMNKIEKAKRDYPGLKINLMSNSGAKDMISMLENHDIDFIIDTVPEYNMQKNFTIEKLSEIHNVFISKNKLDIKNKKDFEKLDFILNFDYTLTHKNLMEVLEKNKIKITPKMQCEITEVRVDAVKRNLGVGYVMKEAVQEEIDRGDLFEVNVPGTEFPITDVNLIYIKDQLTKADKKFIKKYLKK